MLTVFLFARLWRRSGVTTDIELAELRYSGKPAAFLRGFRSVYLGVVMNCIILGWVNLAMVKILMLVLGVDKARAEAFSFALAVVLTPPVVAREAMRLIHSSAANGETVLASAAIQSLFGAVVAFFAGLLALKWLN